MMDKSTIFEDISILAKMCNSKSDGPTLKIEENEINNKIAEYEEEIEDIKTIDADDSYDTSAEMADRNIEIISKKIIQATSGEIKNKTLIMDEYKEQEEELSNTLHGLKRTKLSYEKYISSLRERLTSSSDNEITERYNNLISETETKIIKQDERIQEAEEKYQELQGKIESLSNELNKLEDKLETKKNLLAEAQSNLANKEVYIDKVKKEKADKRIAELEQKIESLNNRLEDINKDPKYLELKIKEILTSDKDNYESRNYLIELLNTASNMPYMDQYVDQELEDKLVAATKERDDFAALIDSKSYDIMETLSPEQIRVDFLNKRIAYYQNELNILQERVNNIDKDANFQYREKQEQIDELITKLKEETREFKEEYEKESDNNLSNKAILKISYEEKKADLDAAEEIASKFRKNEAEDAEEAGRIIKQDIARLNRKIKEAEDEIFDIKERLTNRKSGMKDISAKNKDREKLAELAQVVIDIKHRRLFSDRAFDIAVRLENNLGINLIDAVYTPEEKDIITKEPIPVVEPIRAEETEEESVVEEVPEEDIENSEEETEVADETEVETEEESEGGTEYTEEETEVPDETEVETEEEVPEEETEATGEDIEYVEEETEVPEDTELVEEESAEIEEAPTDENVNEEESENSVEENPNEEEIAVEEDNNEIRTITEEPIIPSETMKYTVGEVPIEDSSTNIVNNLPTDEPEEPAIDLNQIVRPTELPNSEQINEQPVKDFNIPSIATNETVNPSIIPIAEPSQDDNYTFNVDDMIPHKSATEDQLQETTEINFEDSFPSVVQVDDKDTTINSNIIPNDDPVIQIDPNPVGQD